MLLHDWTRVDAAIFHDFHLAWIAELQKRLNGSGVLAESYAIIERHANHSVNDILELRGLANEPAARSTKSTENEDLSSAGSSQPEVAVGVLDSNLMKLRRTLTVRHISTHRVIALLEIVSPANKDRGEHVEEFAIKTITALERGVHVLVVDLFPPGAHEPNGIHAAIRQRLVPLDHPFELPRDQPQTLVSYVAGQPKEVYLNHMSVGEAIPETPLFLTRERYVNLPLEATYGAAYEGIPSFWQDVLEGKIN